MIKGKQIRKRDEALKGLSFRQVAVEEGEKKANEYNIMFIETSAKAGYNVIYSLCN